MLIVQNLYFYFQAYNFDVNGLYYCRVLISEKKNKTNPVSVDPKLMGVLSMGRSFNLGGFLGVGANRVELKKK